MKRSLLLIGFAAMLMLLFPAVGLAAEAPPVPAVKVEIDGKPIGFEIDPILKSDRTFVQFRPTFEDLGMKVEWDSAAQKVTGTKGGYTIELTIGQTVAYVNGTAFTLDAAPFITGSYTMVPLRFISEATGRFVHWDAGTRLVSIVKTDLSQFTDRYYGTQFTYSGDLKGDVREGNGKLIDPQGVTFYEGGFVNGKLEGQGKYYDKNGYLIYEGSWKNNLPDGTGKWYYGDGKLKYEGSYKNGKREGTGTFTWRLSDGGDDFTASLPEGSGTAELDVDGDNTYTGSFANDKFEGKGKIVWADGTTYEGSFKDGELHGKGVLTWPDKWKYEGDFAFGVRTGSGSVYDADGNLIYKGEFKNNLYSGLGELFDASGKVIFQGEFVSGKPKE